MSLQRKDTGKKKCMTQILKCLLKIYLGHRKYFHNKIEVKPIIMIRLTQTDAVGRNHNEELGRWGRGLSLAAGLLYDPGHIMSPLWALTVMLSQE